MAREQQLNLSMKIGLVAIAALFAAGCPTEEADAEDAETDDVGETEGGDCDPVGANPEVGALLNAPLDASVEVISKSPQHPGPPGPADLP